MPRIRKQKPNATLVRGLCITLSTATVFACGYYGAQGGGLTGAVSLVAIGGVVAIIVSAMLIRR